MISVSKQTSIYTIGYEGVVFETFLRKLKNSGIKQLIDVRRNPISRKPGFSKNKLAQKLQAEGITYIHIPELGIPSEMRRELNNKEDYVKLFDKYETDLLPTAQRQKEILINLLEEKPSVLLCFESDPEYCHRTRLAKVIADETGLQQIHLHYSH
ncbi:MAG: DUF488 domain-containing protein [Planctomycetaceae bacterium]|nr:DUF488 domain-containing protein [Planctomycetaceae bacterium]